GIAVYQDGVRINDPFGDIVQWALVPEGAIASMDVIPGSNPMFGLNALGGALSLRTKTGITNPGTNVEATYGSFGRTIAKIESGGELANGLSYYGNARYLDEEGWRDYSPSQAVHLFGDVGWRDEDSSLNLNLTRVETDLIGNGPAPFALLEEDRDAVYTHPDITRNSLTFLTLAGNHRFSSQLELQSVAYARRSNIDSLNGDESPFAACESDPTWVCDEDGDIAHDLQGNRIPFEEAVDGAALNRGRTEQDSYGLSAQLGIPTSLGNHENRLIVGASYDRSLVRFGSTTELASFDDTRGAIGSGTLVEDPRVDLQTHLENSSVFLTDTFGLTPQLDVTLSGRFNDTHIRLEDEIGTALNGDHQFSRFNAAAGMTYRPSPLFTLYASYSESNRAPSPVELTCADENDPCALPNAFLSDPPLEQVIARTTEAGARGSWRNLRWHAGLFRTENENDILFISAGALTNHGFFENVGDTRRQGMELNLSGKTGRLDWFASYTELQAEFRESFPVFSPNNPESVDGEIQVFKGARIPGIPERMLKAGGSLLLTPTLSVDLDVAYQSNQFFRGDEANLTPPLPGYTVVNAALRWIATDNLTFFAQLDNLLDEKYETFGLYGAASDLLGPSAADDPRFVSPASPRGVWIGLRLSL
ncbi:MAG: TonB-dependent receptor, partial [Povalibacter sp.]